VTLMCKKLTFAIWCVTAILLFPLAGAAGEGNASSSALTADQVIQRMIEQDEWRRSALQQYTSNRRYVVDNVKFNKHAEVTVREKYVYPGQKEFETLSGSGSDYIRHKVISKLIEAELDAAKNQNRDQTRITPEHYKFELLGTEEQEGHPCFLISVVPNRSEKYLIKGRIWVDQKDFAIVRMEGSPAKNPSFWTRKVQFTRRYQKQGPFWMAASIESESEVFVAGKSALKIEYFDYVITQGESHPIALLTKGVSR
jgi:Outer membrane lipoprotein-sorting protein